MTSLKTIQIVNVVWNFTEFEGDMKSRRVHSILSLVTISFLLYGIVFAQSDSDWIGIGCSAGVSLPSSGDPGDTYIVSAFLDRSQDMSYLIIRLQGEIGTWGADARSEESFGSRDRVWRLSHLSVSTHILLDVSSIYFTLGLGTGFLLVHETETTHYDVDKVGFTDDDKNTYSSIGFDLFPVIGVIVPVSRVVEISLSCRYNFVMQPTDASRLAITAGVSFLLK